MKKIIFSCTLIFCVHLASAQFVYKIKADSVMITRDSCTAELIIENSTKAIRGFLYNKGNGRTEFRKATRINDSTLIVGDDTIVVTGRANAFNGLSVSGNKSQLGQDVGASGNPAALQNNREIPMNGFNINLAGSGNLGIRNPNPNARIDIIEDREFATFAARPALIKAESWPTTYPSGASGYLNTILQAGENALLKGPITISPGGSTHNNTIQFYRLFSNSGGTSPNVTITAPSTPSTAVPTIAAKAGLTDAGAVTYNGYMSVINTMAQLNASGTKTIQHFIDLNVGLYQAGPVQSLGSRYGLYINPIKQSYVTNAYGVYQEGANDINYFNGRTGFGTASPEYKLDIRNSIDSTYTMMHLTRGNTDIGGYISATDYGMLLSGNATPLASSFQWKAKAPSAVMMAFSSGGVSNSNIAFFMNEGLTPGQNFNPRNMMQINVNGTCVNTTGIPTYRFVIQNPDSNTLALENNTPLSATSGAGLRLYNTNLPTTGNQRLASIFLGSGSNHTVGTRQNGAQIQAFSEGSWTNGVSYPAYLVLGTTSSGSNAPQERLRITSVGNIGIGTTSPTSLLHVNGTAKLEGTLITSGRRAQVKNISSNTTLVDSDEFAFGNASSGNITIQLPSAAGRAGQIYTIKKTDTSGNSVIVAAAGAETIDGNSTLPMTTPGAKINIISDGTNWQTF